MTSYDYSAVFATANKKADDLKLSNNPEDQEKFIEIKMSLIQLAELCQQFPEKNILEVVKDFYEDGLKFLVENQEKQMKDAKIFCAVQKLSEKETQETLDRVKVRLENEMVKFKEYQNYLTSLLGLNLI